MSLQDEISQLLWQHTASDPPPLASDETPVTERDTQRVLLAGMSALEQAVLRLARELDERAYQSG